MFVSLLYSSPIVILTNCLPLSSLFKQPNVNWVAFMVTVSSQISVNVSAAGAVKTAIPVSAF